MLHQKPLTKVRGSFFVSTANVSRQIGTELEQHGHAAGFGTGLLSKPPIFRTKGAKSWPVLPLRRRDFWFILLTCILFCIFLFSRAKGGILTNYLFQFSRILAFCFLGEICEVCKGARYNRETLEVKYKEKTISDVLNMTVEEAVVFFANQPKIARKLQTLLDVGLGYVTLGQSATTLSGGEAQRVKLANELARRSTGKTVYILDEPTTGLHMADVHRLIEVLQKLVDAGNTVIVIEHNLDLIKCADHIIDLGPEGGSAGGLIVAEGTPEQVAEVPGSFTGQYLKPLLEKDAKLRAEGK